MAKVTVQGMILSRLEVVEGKLDILLNDAVPNIKLDAIKEATKIATFRSMIVGGITLVVSIAGLAVAYFKP